MSFALLGFGIIGKLLFVVFVIFILLIVGGVGFNSFKTGTTKGQIVDCQTGQPLSDVNVLFRRRGWGINQGQLVWDKDYIYQTVSDAHGNYKISYIGDPTNIVLKRKSYVELNIWKDLRSDMTFKLLAKRSEASEWSTDECVT